MATSRTSDNPHPSTSAPKPSEESESVYDALCGICFTHVDAKLNPRGSLNSCDHLFCSYCIKLWAKKTNVCPACKARFTRIYTINPDTERQEETKVRRKNLVVSESDVSENEDEERSSDDDRDETRALQPSRASSSSAANSVQCEVCHESSNAARIVFCDRHECAYAVHLDCLGMAERPLTFLCPRCALLQGDACALATASPPPKTAEVVIEARASEPPLSQLPSGDDNDRRPITLSRPPPISRGLSARASRQASAATREDHRTSSSTDDDLYFLAPSEHSRAARTALEQLNQTRSHEHTLRRAREAVKRRRLEDAALQRDRSLYGQAHMGYHLPLRSSLQTLGEASSATESKPAGTTALEQRRKMLDIAEKDLLDPQLRASVEQRLTHEWAADLMHVLRRNESIAENRLRLDADGNPVRDAPLTSDQVAAKEKALWQRATQQARTMVSSRLDGRLREIRERRERLVKAEAQREAAALSKLARIIAARRNALA